MLRVGVDKLPGTGSPINLSKPSTIPTITLTNRQQLFSKTANTTPPINMLYSNRRRSHEPTNCIKISTHAKTNKQTVPSLFLTNACHILNKIDELSSVAEINDPDLICISESWLDSSISDMSDIIPGRRERTNFISMREKYGQNVVTRLRKLIKLITTRLSPPCWQMTSPLGYIRSRVVTLDHP